MPDPPVTVRSLVVVGAHKVGRPRAVEPLASQVVSWIPDQLYAKICQTADEQGVKVSALVRSVLVTRFK